MQNRVPTPGQEGRVLITPENGGASPFYATVEMADNPSQPGTPWDVANVLQDSTAKLYGLDNAAVPDDVFEKIVTAIDPVGTIKTTVRTDLGENWLLCNGEKFSPEEYPDLYAAMPAADPSNNNWDITSAFNGQNTLNIEFGNGVYAATINNKNFIFYANADSVDSPWSQVSFSSNNNAKGHKIRYLNGYWIICGNKTVGSDMAACLWYATSITGEWTEVEIKNVSSNKFFATDIVYANEKWVVCGYQYVSSASTSFIWYSHSISGPWNEGGISSPQSLKLDTITFNGEYFATAGFAETDTNRGYFYYATDPSKWYSKQVYTSLDHNPYVGLGDIKYANNKWIAAGYSTFNHNINRPYIFSCSTIDGSWSNDYCDDSQGKTFYADQIAYGNGFYVISGSSNRNAPVLISSDAAPGVWEYVELTDYTSSVVNVNFVNDSFICGLDGGKAAGLLARTLKNMLPFISNKGFYSYIKAKIGL